MQPSPLHLQTSLFCLLAGKVERHLDSSQSLTFLSLWANSAMAARGFSTLVQILISTSILLGVHAASFVLPLLPYCLWHRMPDWYFSKPISDCAFFCSKVCPPVHCEVELWKSNLLSEASPPRPHSFCLSAISLTHDWSNLPSYLLFCSQLLSCSPPTPSNHSSLLFLKQI